MRNGRALSAILFALPLCFSILGLPHPSAIAAEVRMRVPTVCPGCALDIEMKQVEASWQKQAERQRVCLATRTEDANRSEFKYGDCDLVPMVFSDICDIRTPTSNYYFWAPAASFPNGPKLAADVLKYLSSSVVFNSKRVHGVLAGQRIMETSASTEDEQHIAICDTRRTAGALGPPTNCGTVAIRTATDVWLRGGTAWRFVRTCDSNPVSMIRESGMINVGFEVTTTMNVSVFSTRLKAKLISDLALSVELEETTDSKGTIVAAILRSTAPLRDSKILAGGWREAFNFDVSLSAQDGKVRIHGATQPLVCRQALGNIRDYQGLSDAQRSAYASALDNLVEASVASACKTFHKHDARRITCH
jgi:hypothetical protein